MAWVRIVAVSGAKAPELHGYLCGTAEAVPFRSKVYETRSRKQARLIGVGSCRPFDARIDQILSGWEPLSGRVVASKP
jgi:hypothetical protein